MPTTLSACAAHNVAVLQGALLLPALRYAENGTFTINFWQRVHRRFPDASQYMLSHQSLLPADVNASAWGADQVQVVEPLCAPISKLLSASYVACDVLCLKESGVSSQTCHSSTRHARALIQTLGTVPAGAGVLPRHCPARLRPGAHGGQGRQ